MKIKVRVTDKKTGKVLEGERNLRNEMHFEVQKRTRAHVFVDRRFKKPKHKNKVDDE